MKPIALIPHYNHGATLAAVCTALRAHGLPVLVIDDGSNVADLAAARELAAHAPAMTLPHRAHNRRTGPPVKDGIHPATHDVTRHALHQPADYEANRWPGYIKAMLSRTPISKDESWTVVQYLQKHSKDVNLKDMK